MRIKNQTGREHKNEQVDGKGAGLVLMMEDMTVMVGVAVVTLVAEGALTAARHKLLEISKKCISKKLR